MLRQRTLAKKKKECRVNDQKRPCLTDLFLPMEFSEHSFLVLNKPLYKKVITRPDLKPLSSKNIYQFNYYLQQL